MAAKTCGQNQSHSHCHSPVYDVLSAPSITERTFFAFQGRLAHNPNDVGSRLSAAELGDAEGDRQCDANCEPHRVWDRGLWPLLFMGTSQMKKHCEHDVKTAEKAEYTVQRNCYKPTCSKAQFRRFMFHKYRVSIVTMSRHIC